MQRCALASSPASLRPRHRAAPRTWCPAFDFLALCDDPALQLTAARGWSASEVAGIAPLAPRPRRASRKLRLGFVSSDFGNHPVGRLVIALLERLDRERFEVIAFVTTAETRDAFRLRAERAVDQFAVIDRSDPARCAQALQAEAIDVLFDLNGYSGGEAVRIFAHRPAPLQVNFLGYTGTLGSPHYDVIVGDAYCIPADAEAAYTESVVRIDSCYLPSDPLRMVDQGAPTRAQYGLPDTGVVFCAFAAIAKIDPSIFDVWMSLLRDTPGSVLWLRHIPTDRLARLRDEAQRRGVAATRLVVAPADPIPRYLARFALADVFLDTAPFGSHTTVNDALFTGLPVVTIAGSSFAARASASQLAALGLHDLIARDHAHMARSRSGWRRRPRCARRLPRGSRTRPCGRRCSTWTPTRGVSKLSSRASFCDGFRTDRRDSAPSSHTSAGGRAAAHVESGGRVN